MTPALKNIKGKLQQLPAEAYVQFVKETPIDTGNARRKTKLLGSKIRAAYAYAKRLDRGWSKQSPRGMIAPTKEWMRKRIRQILRKK
tara:strand:+ start:94 stop:354 length:261 start_codon:yes stop_codon:yes gene_type:complete